MIRDDGTSTISVERKETGEVTGSDADNPTLGVSIKDERLTLWIGDVSLSMPERVAWKFRDLFTRTLDESAAPRRT